MTTVPQTRAGRRPPSGGPGWQAGWLAKHGVRYLILTVGAAIMVPIILAYTGYAYWVFRGKTADEGYH